MFQVQDGKEKKTSKITNKQQLREVGALKEKNYTNCVKKHLTREKKYTILKVPNGEKLTVWRKLEGLKNAKRNNE